MKSDFTEAVRSVEEEETQPTRPTTASVGMNVPAPAPAPVGASEVTREEALRRRHAAFQKLLLTDPLQFWRVLSRQTPTLAVAFRKVNGSPAAAASPERVFSSECKLAYFYDQFNDYFFNK